jgi:hypothetical protein
METDSRLKRDTLGVDRRPRAPEVTRDDKSRASGDRDVAESREHQDREVTEDRELTEEDRLEMFREQMFNDALPDLPPIPGYHVCWLTTTNPRDPIQRRLRLGYELIKASDVPGMEYTSMKGGQFDGCVSINEMIAAKLPTSLYLKFMEEAHHKAPAREEGKLADTAAFLRQQAQQKGATVIDEDGSFEELRRAPPRGRFAT